MEKSFVAATLTTALTSYPPALPVAATSNPVGRKVGTATATGYLGTLFFSVDTSIQKAVQNGGITEISAVNIKHRSILGIVVSYETIAAGKQSFLT